MSAAEHPLAGLIAELGHEFRQPALLEEALTHPSATEGEGCGKRNLERLEFLGDRVLGLVVARLLMDEFPDEKVGQVARRHAALVSSDALARVARRLELGNYMSMSSGERRQGGADNPQALADCCEAVIAALYLDGGDEAAGRMIYRYWHPLMRESVRPPRDSKSTLQEWALARALPLPVYTVLRRDGAAHEPLFHVECTVCGLPPARAEGRSRRSAEQAAARQMIAHIENCASDDGQRLDVSTGEGP